MNVIDIPGGRNISDAIAAAIAASGETGERTSFEFNDTTVTVAQDSDPDLIYRDWERASRGYIDTVGPHPNPMLSDEERESDARIKAEEDRRWQQELVAFRARVEAHRAALTAKLADAPAFAVSDAAAHDTWHATTDSYGQRTLEFADQWARLMQVEIARGAPIEGVAKPAADEADVDGISGAAYGAAVAYLASCWEHGDQLRQWHTTRGSATLPRG